MKKLIKKRKKPVEETKTKGADRKSTKVNNNKLELLVTVVNKEKADYYMDLIQSFDVNMQLMSRGHGTSNSFKDLSLPEVEKAVIFSVIKSSKVNDVLTILEKKFNTIRNGKGIAYSIPMTSVIGSLVYSFLSDNTSAVPQQEEKKNGR